jgi:hypothetical protein
VAALPVRDAIVTPPNCPRPNFWGQTPVVVPWRIGTRSGEMSRRRHDVQPSAVPTIGVKHS